MISQEYFDETLLESQELFEYDDDQAVEETIKELQQSASTGQLLLDHLSQTHPDSPIGKVERARQSNLKTAMKQSNTAAILDLLEDGELTTQRRRAAQNILFIELMESNETILQTTFATDNEPTQPEQVSQVITFLLKVLPSDQHPLTRQLRLKSMEVLQDHWCQKFVSYRSSNTTDLEIQTLLLRLMRSLCNYCEPNKKAFVQSLLNYRNAGAVGGDGIDVLVAMLRESSSSDADNKNEDAMNARSKEICLLLRVLGTFQASSEPAQQDGQAPLVSSAHATMLEFHKHGTVPCLYRLATQTVTAADTVDATERDATAESLSIYLSALRVLAIDNDMVQNMTALGTLGTIHMSLQKFSAYPNIAASTLALLRNLCANDEIKTTVCKSSLNEILHILQEHASHVAVQEHGCGILTAMALREPNNARAILQADGMTILVQMMERFRTKVSLQRQCALAVRNIVSRLSSEEKTEVLNNSSIENVLRNICGHHQGSVEEGFAALRDLGCEATIYKVNADGAVVRGTEEFGKVKSNFRQEYDEVK